MRGCGTDSFSYLILPHYDISTARSKQAGLVVVREVQVQPLAGGVRVQVAARASVPAAAAQPAEAQEGAARQVLARQARCALGDALGLAPPPISLLSKQVSDNVSTYKTQLVSQDGSTTAQKLSSAAVD